MGSITQDVPAFVSGMKTQSLCKICKAFSHDADAFMDITRDIHMGVSRQEIINKYSPKLPEGMAPLNRVNIASHKYHTNPKKLIQSVLMNPHSDPTDGSVIVKILEDATGQQLNKERVMEGLNIVRLQDMADIELMIMRNRARWQKAMNEKSEDNPDELKELERTESRMLSLVERRQDLQDKMHRLLLQEMKDGRDSVEYQLRVEIYRMMIDNLNLHLSSFMREISDILLHDEFAEHPDRGVRIFKRFSQIMNKHMQPMMKELVDTGMVAEAKYEDIPS